MTEGLHVTQRWASAGVLVVLSFAGVSCGGGQDQVEDNITAQLIESNSGGTLGTTEEQVLEESVQVSDTIRLGGRFDWCWELQVTWDDHAMARAQFEAADQIFNSATDELDIAETSAARDNARHSLEVTKYNAMSVLREAVDASQGELGETPKAIAYSRAWDAFTSSDAAAATFEKTEAAVQDILDDVPAHLTDVESLDLRALEEAEAALPAINAALSERGSDYQHAIDVTRTYYDGLVYIVSSLQDQYSNHDEARADFSRAADVAWDSIFVPKSFGRLSPWNFHHFRVYYNSDTGVYRNIGLINVRGLSILAQATGGNLVANARAATGWGSRTKGQLESTLEGTIDDLGISGKRIFPNIETFIQGSRDSRGKLILIQTYALPFAVAIGVWRNSGIAANDHRFDVENAVFVSLLRNGGSAYDAFKESFQESCQ